jgi:hypothetical protein
VLSSDCLKPAVQRTATGLETHQTTCEMHVSHNELDSLMHSVEFVAIVHNSRVRCSLGSLPSGQCCMILNLQTRKNDQLFRPQAALPLPVTELAELDQLQLGA